MGKEKGQERSNRENEPNVQGRAGQSRRREELWLRRWSGWIVTGHGGGAFKGSGAGREVGSGVGCPEPLCGVRAQGP